MTFAYAAAAVLAALLTALAMAGSAPHVGAPMPYVIIKPNVHMPVVGLGSCCGTYNVTAWIGEGFRAIDTSCDYGSQGTIGECV